MSFLRSSQRIVRAPETEVLPDGRKRLTAFLDARSLQQIPTDLELPYGTEYDSAAPAGWENLRLLRKLLTDDQAPPGRDTRPILQLTYEQLHPTDETQVGQNTVTKLEDGRQAIVAEFLQFRTAPAVAVTVGATTAPGDAAAYLQSQVVADNGTLRSIKRTYVYAGVISTDDQALNGGALLRKTIVSVKTVPSTPSGFVLVGSPVQFPNGLPVYSYTYFKGDGEVSRASSSANGGKLQRVEITHLTATSVSAQPTADPLSGGVAIVTDRRDDSGHRIWEVTWVKGEGEVRRRSSDDAGGKLQRVIITHLTASAVVSQPTSDPLSGGVAIVSGVEDETGHRVWEVTWAKGNGEVARRSLSRLQGMLQRVEITHLTATSVTSQPTSDPLSGGTLIDDDYNDEAGHRVWRVVWVKANTSSLVTDSSRRRNKGKLVIYERSRLGAAPAAPSATIGGVVVETDAGQSLEDGYVLYRKEWAEGEGVIEDSRQLRNQGKLVVYRQRALGTAPAAPAATLGGTVVLTEDNSREDTGVSVYDRSWAEGKGVYAKRTQARDGGLRLETWESLGASYDDSFMKPPGLLMARDHDDMDGATRWTVTCMQKKDGAALGLASGQLTAINVVSGGNSYSSDPTVTIGAPPSGGVQATAIAVRSGSVVSSVTITNPGSGYLTAPSIGFTGGGGADASATATIDGAPETALEFEIKHPFDFPGRAKVITTTLETNPCFDVYKSPPIRVLIDATVRVSYQSASELGALPYTLWNPEEWTSIFAKFRSYPDGWPRTISESLPGYRAVSTTPVTFDGGLATAKLQTCLGEKVANAVSGTPYSLQLAGGPVNPEGSTYLIAKPEIEPVFSSFDGTQYYRKTIIFATIPAQPALPV